MTKNKGGQIMTGLCFKNVFSNYDEFKEFTGQFSLYEDTDTLAESFNKHIYYCLLLHYNNCKIAYSTIDEFKAEFTIAYNQMFKQYLNKNKVLNNIYSLTANDFEIMSESINNFSNNPNYQTTDPWELLDFLHQPHRATEKSILDVLDAHLTALFNSVGYVGVLDEPVIERGSPDSDVLRYLGIGATMSGPVGYLLQLGFL